MKREDEVKEGWRTDRPTDQPTARFTISGVTLRGAEVRFSREGKSAFPRPRVYTALLLLFLSCTRLRSNNAELSTSLVI